MNMTSADSATAHTPQRSSDGRPAEVAIICGPTASGKTALALALAQRIPSVVINADSAQVYRDLAILSARPDETEMAGIPHRLFGHVGGDDDYSAARWAEEATREIAAATADGRRAILVGGTGLYIRTLIDGIAPVPEIDQAVRDAVRALPVAQAYAALKQEDPAAAKRLNRGDTTRVARALEVVRSSGRALADWQSAKTGGIGASTHITATILLPPREWLFDRCDQRLVAMMAGGAIAEVEALLAHDYPPESPVMRAIGVRDIAAMLAGEFDYDEALANAQLATRRYAKRQYTWFRNQPPADWTRVEATPDAALVANIADTMAAALAG